jgi:hypothetical protein
MPFIHIRSLPPSGRFESSEAVRAISRDFAAAAAADEQDVTVTWQILQPGHYSHAGNTATERLDFSHPILVELVAPDFHPPQRVEQLLGAAAQAVARAASVDWAHVFVEFRTARAGYVFEGGQIVRW